MILDFENKLKTQEDLEQRELDSRQSFASIYSTDESKNTTKANDTFTDKLHTMS